MTKHRVGVVLALLFAVLAAGAAFYEDLRVDRLINQEHVATEAVQRELESVQTAIANLRGAQAAYFAIGQGSDFWLKRASELAAEVEGRLSHSRAASGSAAAVAHYDSALSALGTLNSLDQKAREDFNNGEARLAADAIFTDATTAVGQLTTAVSAAEAEEVVFSNGRVSELRIWRLRAEAGGLGALLIAALVLSLMTRRPAVDEPAVPATDRIIAPRTPLIPSLPVVPAKYETTKLSSLSDAAGICVDLARVLDGADVPPILARAARAIGAKGLVLWVADASGAMLRPSLAHGYPDQVLQRLGPLPIDADNVTSLAFRTMQAQTLAGASGATGALAVPLITSTGCIGVLAAEVTKADSSQDTIALARIFAAQLATIVTPAEAGGAKTAHG